MYFVVLVVIKSTFYWYAREKEININSLHEKGRESEAVGRDEVGVTRNIY